MMPILPNLIVMKIVSAFIFFLIAHQCFGHNPDFSSLMIYQQGEKTLLVIKSSLTAFEGEINYHFTKDGYKTPAEFNKLIIKHFERNCAIIINKDTIPFIHPQVQLGHETTVVAELNIANQSIKTYHIKNTIFKDMPNNLCEVIISLTGLPQRQLLLSSSNNHVVDLKVLDKNWILIQPEKPLSKNHYLFLWIGLILLIGIVVFILGKRNMKI